MATAAETLKILRFIFKHGKNIALGGLLIVAAWLYIFDFIDEKRVLTAITIVGAIKGMESDKKKNRTNAPE